MRQVVTSNRSLRETEPASPAALDAALNPLTGLLGCTIIHSSQEWPTRKKSLGSFAECRIVEWTRALLLRNRFFLCSNGEDPEEIATGSFCLIHLVRRCLLSHQPQHRMRVPRKVLL